MKNLVLNLRNAKAQAGCAESKHTSLSFRKGLGVGLTCLLLTLGVGQMWGEISYSGGYIYFDNSLGINSTTLQICARQSSWTGVSSLTNIGNTKLYYVANPQGSGWAGILGWVVISANPAKSNSNFDNWSSYTWCSDWNTYGFNSGSTYLIVPSSTSKSQSVTTTYYSGGYSGLNSTQTIKSQVSTNGGSTYSDANSKATISVTSYKLSGNGTSAKQTASVSTSAKSTTISAARTATTTVSIGDVASGFTFVGWYDGSTQLSTATSYTYYPTAAQTITAKFKNETTYTITIANSVNASTSTVSVGATPVQITAPDIAGYYFTTWSAMPTGVTKTSGNLTDASIYISATKAATVTANYNAKTKVRLYYTNPGNFSTPTAYFWYSTTTSDNSGWPGIAMTSVTECGTTYYYVEYYKEDHPNWNRVIFNDNGNSSTQTSDITFSNTTNNNQYNNAPASKSGTGSWSATPPARWVVAGSWDSYSTASNLLTCDDGTLYTDITTLSANTDYQFKLFDTYSSTWYGVTTATKITYENRATAQTMNNTAGGSPNQTMKTAAAGTYRFTWDPSNKQVTITYPTSYKVELEVGTVKGNKQTPGIYLDSYEEANKLTSGDYVAAGSHVIFVVASSLENAAKDGYTWCGFFNNAAGTTPTQYTNNGVTTYNINSIAANAHVYACFYENDYNVNVASSDATNAGTVAQSYMTAHKDTKMTIPSASAKTGFYFVNWTKTGTATLYSATSATAAQINGVTANNAVTVTANFAPKWSVASTATDPEWSTTANKFTTAYYQESSKWKGNKTITLAANTEYELKMYDLQSTPHWYGTNHTADEVHVHYADGNVAKSMSDTDGSAKNLHLHTAAGGDYTLKWNVTDKSLQITFPTSWYITTGVNDALGGSFTAIDNASNNVYGGKFVANNASVVFTATANTGYDFAGWYSNAACTTPYTAGANVSFSGEGNSIMTLSSITADKTVYAKFTPKNYNVALNMQSGAEGYGSGSDRNEIVTYNTTLTTVGSLPTAAQGYAFMGFYTATGGRGTQFINASGTWATSVTDTISDSKWILDAGTTLYAYYKKAEITGITFSPAAAEPGDEVTATATISPTPSGTTTVCWEVRYASNDVPLDPQPTLTPASGASVTFTAPPAAVYKFIATLKTGNDCSGGTILDTENANLTVAGSHPVTIRYKHGDVVIKEETIQNIHATVATEISAPNIIGYSFSSWTLGDGITKESGALTDASITVTAIYDGVITANYNTKRMIYFYNTLGWSGVNVYFYKNDSYWNASNGTGSSHTDTYTSTPFSESKYGAMTRIEGTNIWYFDAEDAGVNASYDDVVFTEYLQYDYHFFSYKYGTTTPNKVARRGDYKSSMPMFVPVEQDGVSMNGGQAIYYSEGYWMNYPENTGYKVMIYNAWNADKTSPAQEYYFPYSEDKKMPLKLDVEFNTADAKWFMIYRNDGTYMGVNAVMTQASHTNYRISSCNDKIKIQPSATGIYTYTLTFYDDGEKDGGGRAYGNMYHISVDYPVSVGDYRILYKDNATWSQGTAHTASWNHPSDAINKISGEATEAKKDTVSLFVSYGASATAKFQYVTAINPTTGAVTWADVDGGTISLSSITKSGTYNFIVTQPVGGASVSVEKIEAYTGNYYIRTDCAGNTKWDNYRAADHQMTYSEFSCSEANSFGEKFSHYFAHWCPAGMNVKFVIANDYSSCISDTLIQDVGNPYANINRDGFLNSDGNPEETENRFSANIRFMYNEATNKISRAYVASSTNKARWFLVLRSNTEILDDGGDAMEEIGEDIPSVILDDKQNWIYEQTLQILPGSKFKLFACYAEVTPSQSGAQYFRGYWASDDWSNAANTIELVGGSPASGRQLVRVLYDFKTNRLVCAWLPSGEISDEIDINADVMIIREHQEDAQMITFANANAKLTDVKTVYGTMKFNRWTLNNKSSAAGHAVLPSVDQKSIYERSLYFISFPFDVNLGEVFGFGTYGIHWIIENYDGENRAKNGYWIDSEPNWKYVMSPKGYTLEANKGYILALDLDQMRDDNEDFWSHDIETVELFFPSAVTQSTIEQNNVTIPAPDPSIYQCTINRPGPDGDRRIKDSYWRCLGVPSFANYTTTLSDGSAVISWQTADNTLPYLYYWNMVTNTLVPQSTSTWTFKTMHAYLTQCSTQIIWTAASKPTPSSIVARRAEDEQISNIEFRLELAENEVKADQAYVRFSTREDVTSGFEFGNDLSKEMNVNKSNIYTLIGSERAAANSLPLSTEQTTIVPVGVVANAAGEYTFSIPEGTDGIGVTFIDNETGIHTQLGALDYTVTLDKGTYESRFYLEISPIHGTPTDVGEVRGERLEVRGVRKVIIDQNMYIIRDGKMYDARGARVE